MKKKLLIAKAILISLLLIISHNSFSQACPPPDKIKKRLADEFAAKINNADTCEAYPFLSADGLRLYFTSDREEGFGKIFFCNRNSLTENFGTPRQLSKQLPDGFYAATLTADELTLYCCNNGEIYKTTRKSLHDDFSKPLKLTDFEDGWKFAPAISSYGNELILVKSKDTKDELVHYRKNPTGIFIEVNSIKAPGDNEPDPGQFSKDGLSFYISFEQKKADSAEEDDEHQFKQTIIKYYRNSVTENFIKYDEIPELNVDLRNHQPTMNGDETIFIVVNTGKDSWSENDLKFIDVSAEQTPETVDEPKQIIVPDSSFRFSIPDTCLVFSSPFDTTVFVWRCSLGEIQCTLFEEIVLVDSVISEQATSKPVIIPDLNPQIKIYPNPFIDNLVITLPNESKNASFELLDISGRKIMSTRLNNGINRIQITIPLSGIFVYRITSDTGNLISSGKLVKN